MLKTRRILSQLQRLVVKGETKQQQNSFIAASQATDESKFSKFYEKHIGKRSGYIDRERVGNRWKMFIPAFAVHGCIGASYGWSHISSTLMREQGVVTSAAGDWSLDLVTYPMTILVGGIGFSSAILGRWVSKVGPRRAMLQGSLTLAAGYGLTSFAICSHNIFLLYPGVGLIAFGTGSLYTPPVQILIDWFPDRKGLASGVVISGIGSGVLFFAPMMDFFMNKFHYMPTFVGKSIEVVADKGQYFTAIGDAMREVVYLSNLELAKLPYEGLAEGYYLVGTGSTGVGISYGLMGAVYTTALLSSTFALSRPMDIHGNIDKGDECLAENRNVHVNYLLRTPQFWLLFSTATLLSTGGMGLMSVAKPMVSEIFSTNLPTIVTTSFATAYLMAMSSGNLFGRVGWAALSDRIGRRKTFAIFSLCGLGVYGSIPVLINAIVSNPESSLAPVLLGLFCINTVAAVSILGGVYAVLPAYEADLYGAKHVGAIHTRLLPSATLASVLGPSVLLKLRSMDEQKAIQQLVSNIKPEVFEARFNTSMDNLPQLINSKAITIPRLMELSPPGTIDPSPYMYNTTLYTMAGMVSLASVLHYMVGPVDDKYFNMSKKLEEEEERKNKHI